MFPHIKILKYTWISPDVQNHNQTNQILIDRKWHSIILDVRSFRVVDCDSDRYSITSTNAKSLSPSSGNSRFFVIIAFPIYLVYYDVNILNYLNFVRRLDPIILQNF
jgi:hypothetical protein